jgi:phenylalanyl-tRNA synthetase beta subunit
MKLLESRLTTMPADLMVKVSLFDQFEKEGRTSLAFRFVFQSFSRTLTDEEVHGYMVKISALLTEKGYSVR